MKGLTYSTAPANTLLNSAYCYFVHHLAKFQDIHPYRITSATDIPTLVGTTYPALPGPPAVPETYLFSKELAAPAVLADGAPGGYVMSDEEGGEEEGDEGAGIRDGDALLAGEKEADNVAAVAEGEARLAAAAAAAAGAAAAPAAAARP